ncbi:hypothetical protein [Streptomyces buecherae]|uniref:hypothetical protein n=1 Tax=Streptomyces buecherae TaxID=2763006 RepID=UPI00379567DD
MDAVARAGSVFGKEDLVFEFQEEGPDHQKVFRAIARTSTGRVAWGVGPSKRAARLAAAGALLDKYSRQARAATPRPKTPHALTPVAPPRLYTRSSPGHRQAVADLAVMFELGPEANGLLAQALTHASWTWENQAAVAAADQRSNHFLAHHGSFVINHLSAHARARTAFAHDLRLDEEDARFLTTSDDDTARLGADLDLADGLLTSRGDNGSGRSAVSDAAQAVLAAAWRTRGPELLQRRPAAVDDWLAGLEHRHDPVTVLNAMAVTYGMTYDFEYHSAGPDHLKTYTATVLVRDSAGHDYQWTAEPEGKVGKPEAKKATAQEVLDVLAAPASPHTFDTLTPRRRGLLTALLRAQLDGLSMTTERQRTRILARGDLGADLLATGDTQAFMSWADRISTLSSTEGPAAPEAVRKLYRHIVNDARYGSRSLLRRMAAEQGTDDHSMIRRHAAEVVMRVTRTEPGEKSARDIVQDWWRDQAPEAGIALRDDMRRETLNPLPVQLGALRETLT